MKEREIEKYLVERVKSLGGRAYKFVSPGNVGVPDRLVCFPRGFAVFVELKTASGTLSANQDRQITRLRKLGYDVYILRSVGEVDTFIEIHRDEKVVDIIREKKRQSDEI